jgi:hypothetical protein
MIPWLFLDLWNALFLGKIYKLRISGYYFIDSEPTWFTITLLLKLLVLCYLLFKIISFIRQFIPSKKNVKFKKKKTTNSQKKKRGW